MNDSEDTNVKHKRIYLSYAQKDKGIADQVASALQTAGHNVWLDVWELTPGDSITSRIEGCITSSDFLLVLLSPQSVEAPWIKYELNAALFRELRDRAITVIPVLIEDCEIPQILSGRAYLDLRKDFHGEMQRLVAQLTSAPNIEFSKLTPRTFENLVSDLLGDLGFSIQTSKAADRGFDLIASYQSRDPFGVEKVDTWLVEIKLYREQRVSVSTLRQVLGNVMVTTGVNKGLVVTNSRLTSVAREFLTELTQKHGHELRVIDGAELTDLLIQHPKLVNRYFGGGKP